jgi:hypothetical protein
MQRQQSPKLDLVGNKPVSSANAGVDALRQLDAFEPLQQELRSALAQYWDKAAGILKGSAVRLHQPSTAYSSLESNLFSTLFLYSYYRAGITAPRRILYAAANQCLRGMVTGCDNLLDDEYKKTLDTDLPEQGTRFRSVLDIMVSDRVMFELLTDAHVRGDISYTQLRAASAASLHSLLASGAQEASEQAGVLERLSPDEVLLSVHHHKTGVLFQCPWALPAVIEDLRRHACARLQQALYRIGMGCQILDDMVDLANDVRGKRHNYVASLIHHCEDPEERNSLQDWQQRFSLAVDDDRWTGHFPTALTSAYQRAQQMLEAGLSALFGAEQQHLVEPVIALLVKRIGADRVLTAAA